jgi:hypothetical protein
MWQAAELFPSRVKLLSIPTELFQKLRHLRGACDGEPDALITVSTNSLRPKSQCKGETGCYFEAGA